ncbi:beta-galactosidase [Marisediminicola sp. LYQ85]|uniref:beta-galactosidase n=1 Tax=Marisediminicola sp. LYQ85 TaxID=3391062 RepID=UPI003982D88D
MARHDATTHTAEGILFGAAYYAEYEPSDTTDYDLDLMVDAGFSVIRVGESVWSTWEPRDGEFDTEWLRVVLDKAHERGIRVILGTPTYAIPPWLQVKHPELATELSTGVRMGWGARQEVDYSSPVFARYAERVIRAVVSTYCDHPAVIGYQVDNEPGLHFFHNEGTFAGFVAWLEERYETPEALNREWNLTYWSHRITSFDQLWRPDNNSFPQYDLAWREYQALVTEQFIHWQADIVREYASADQFVTTCIAYPRAAQHDASLAAGLDVTAGNPYYDMQDSLDLTTTVPQLASFITRGVGGLFRQADRLWSSRQERFLVTETNAQAIGGPSLNYPPYPGQLKQAAYAFISRGARMIEYWQWHTLNEGFETYWGGVLPHSREPGRVYREIADIGRSLASVGPKLDGYEPDSDIAIVYSNASKWAFTFFPPFTDDAHDGDPASYYRIFDAFHEGIVESGRQARVLHDTQLLDYAPAEFAEAHPVLVAAGLYITTDEQLAWLDSYAKAGGHLVVGVRTAYADHEARARREVAPPRLAAAAQMHYDEFSNLVADVAVTGTSGFPVTDGARATAWIDGVIPDGAEVVASYAHREHGRFPAITTARYGEGRVTYVGTVPNPELAADIARWLVPTPLAADWTSSPEGSITVQSGATARGRTVRFISNWSGEPVQVRVPEASTDLETGETISAGATLDLAPRDIRILEEENTRA